jgi:hypothetical protein
MDLRDGNRHSDELQFYCDLARVQGRAMTAFMRQASAQAVASPGGANTLHALIKSYDAELSSFSPRLTGERSRFSLRGGQRATTLTWQEFSTSTLPDFT